MPERSCVLGMGHIGHKLNLLDTTNRAGRAPNALQMSVCGFALISRFSNIPGRTEAFFHLLVILRGH